MQSDELRTLSKGDRTLLSGCSRAKRVRILMPFARTVWTPVALGLLGIFALTLTPTTLSSHLPAETATQIGNRSGMTFNLAGTWRFALDRGDTGVKEQWFTRFLPDQIQLPGVLQSQNFGDEVSTDTPWVLSLYDRFWYLREDYKAYTRPHSVKVPFLSQPARHYLGPAWYQRDIQIPTYWVNRRVVLTLERPHWETTVWVDGQKMGSDRSLVAPHIYDLSAVTAG